MAQTTKFNFLHESDEHLLLYRSVEEWKSDIDFYWEELRFCRAQIRERFNETGDVSKSLNESEVIAQLVGHDVQKHFKTLQALAVSPYSKDERMIGDEHRRLTMRMEELATSVRKVKMELLRLKMLEYRAAS